MTAPFAKPPRQPQKKYSEADKQMIKDLKTYGTEILEAYQKDRGNPKKTIMHFEIAMVKMLGKIKISRAEAQIETCDAILEPQILLQDVPADMIARKVVVEQRKKIMAGKA